MEKKYETFTYSELLVEFRTVTEKTESLKRDLILEMGKRKELEGIERKKIAKVIIPDLKDLVSESYIRNILSGVGQTDTKYNPTLQKKELRERAQEEEKKILVAAGMGSQELEPPSDETSEPKRYEPPQHNEVITNQHEDITNLIHDDTEIIDQRPE